MVMCKKLRIGRTPTTGFSLISDTYSNMGAFNATLSISYPAGANKEVSIVKKGIVDECLQSVVLNSSGNGTILFNANQTIDMYAMISEGTCCDTFSYPPCYVSNYIHLEVSAVGNAEFNSIPASAGIYIGGIDQEEVTPSTITDISIGNHSYTLKLDKYNDFNSVVSIVDSETTVLNDILILSEGCINFDVQPYGASITIDDVDTGQVTPAIICDLGLGLHTYKLTIEGYDDLIREVDLTSGYGEVIYAQMSKPSNSMILMLGLGIAALGMMRLAKK